MAQFDQQVVRVINHFTMSADERAPDFITINKDTICVDLWNTRWGQLDEAARAADRLATIFDDAAIRFEIKNQPTGPARDSDGGNLAWDNRPMITIRVPSQDEDESKALELETVARMVKKYHTPARIFVAHA